MICVIAFSVFRHNAFDISSETAARGMISIMQNLFIMADSDFKILRAGDSLCRALETGETALKGNPVSLLVHKDSPNNWAEIEKKLMSGASVENLEILFGYGSKQVPAIMSAMPVKPGTGRDISGFLISAVDISGRKQLETELFSALNQLEAGNQELTQSREEIKENYEKLKELDLMKQNFISIVSHELRTPLTSIKGFLMFLLGGVAGSLNEKQKDFLSTIQGNSEKLLLLINELLDFSKIESGTFAVSKSAADAAAAADKVIREMSSIAVIRKIRLEKDYTADGKIFAFDEERISQVMINLINNSMKFSFPDTVVTLSVRAVDAAAIMLPESKDRSLLKHARYMMFCVKDHGTGMEQKYADRIFDRFYQIENPHVRKHEGIGLGLNIAKSIVEAHEGLIWAQSPGKDKGSSFYFILPLAAG